MFNCGNKMQNVKYLFTLDSSSVVGAAQIPLKIRQRIIILNYIVGLKRNYKLTRNSNRKQHNLEFHF